MFRWALIVGLVVLMLLAVAQLKASQPSIWIDNINGVALPGASGSPESFGPISALATCHTNGAASTTIQWPSHGIVLPAGNDCDVAANQNCAVLFLNTGAGRQFTEILDVPDNNTLTVEDSFNIAAGSAVDCAVGGRITNVTPQLATDVKGNHDLSVHGTQAGGWQIFIVAGGANYQWTASRATGGNAGGAGFYGVKSGSTRPVVECTFTGGACLTRGTNTGADVISIEFRNSNANKTGTIGINGQGNIRDSIIGNSDPALAFADGVVTTAHFGAVIGNRIEGNVNGFRPTQSADGNWLIWGNVFRGNDIGILLNGGAKPVIAANIFWENNVDGIRVQPTSLSNVTKIILNTFHNNGTNGVSITNYEGLIGILFASNLFTNNTTGVSYSGPTHDLQREAALIGYDCWGQGGSANGADLNGWTYGENAIFVDPLYVDVATGDFTPQATNVSMRAWPPGNGASYVGTLTESHVRCGAIQIPGAGGGAGIVNIAP